MKKLIIALCAVAVVLSVSAASMPAQDKTRVAEIASFLADEPGFPSARIDNRALWDNLAKHPNARSAIKAAEEIVSRPMPVLDDSIYTNLIGEVWGRTSAKRIRSLLPLTLAECLENKGRFLPRIIACVEAIASQTTWMNPYHDRAFGNFRGQYRTIDLNGSEAALNLAIVLDTLKGRLPDATVKRVMAAAWLHVFAPYLATADGTGRLHGWFFGNSNWNAACHNQSVGAALRVIADRETRAKFIEGAARGMPYYLSGFSKEGYCQEGMDYWNYGFTEFLRLSHTVRTATSGKVDFFALEKARVCYLYAYGFQLAKDVSPQFGDGTAASPSKLNLLLGELAWPDLKCSATAGLSPFAGGLEMIPVLGALPPAEFALRAALPGFRYPLRSFFEDAQVLICRSGREDASAVAVCLKGGHNGVPHNHNDAGQFIITLGGTQMVQDPAGKIYEVDTFGPKRYEHPMLNSYAHAVPLPDGTLQSPGKDFTAKILHTDFTPDRDEIVLDLKGAYKSDNILKLERRMVYDRVNGTVTVSDDVRFAKPGPYESPISTFGTVVKRDAPGAFTIARRARGGEKRLDFTVDTKGAKWHVKEEKIPNPKRTEPTRWAVVMDVPSMSHSVTFRFSPGEMPPDLSWTVGLETGDPEKGPWSTNYFHSADQDLKVEKIGAGAWRFTCDRFRTHQRTMAVDFVLEAERKGGKTLVRGALKNREGGTRMFSFDGPYVAAAKVVRGRSKFLYPWSNGTLVQKWPETGSTHGRDGSWGFLFKRRPDGIFALNPSRVCEYPSRRCMMQWFALTDGERTRYFAAKDPKFGAKQAVVEYDPVLSTLKFGFNQRFYLPCGETTDLAPVEVFDYAGDWHLAAEDYGAWFTSVRPFAYVPDKVRDCSTLMLLLCKQQNGEMVWPYGDFAQLGDAALRYGIRHIKILARGPGGHDNRYPDYYPDPLQGGTNALMKGLAELKKRGIETYAYVNGQLIECGTTEYWRTGGGSTAGVLCRDGTRAHEAWRKYTDRPPHEFDVACPCDRTWLAKMMEVTKEAQYLGFNGLYFDQVAKQWPWQCWAKNHGHRPGTWVWVEDRVRYLRNIHDEMVKRDPEFILTSEGYNETVSDSCSISLGLGDSSSISHRFETNAIDYKFPEMAFYAFPRLRTSDRYPSPHRSRTDINGTAILGYAADIEVRYPADRRVFEKCENVTAKDYGTVYDKPTWDSGLEKGDLVADRDYFKRVNDFRYANREVILRGDFKDTTGFSVDTEAEHWMAKRWLSKDGRRDGILVWNADVKPQRFSVKCAGVFESACAPGEGAVEAQSPVPANSLRLYLYRRRAP